MLSIPVLSYLAILYLIQEIEHKLNRAKERGKERNDNKVSNVFPLYLLRFYTPYYFEELAIHTLNSFHNREFQDLFF